MKIISPFKDYYDYVSHVYGIDNKIVYTRRPIHEDFLSPIDRIKDLPDLTSITFDHLYKNVKETKSKYEFKWCVIAGKYYLLVGKNGKFSIFTKEHPCAKLVFKQSRYEKYEDCMGVESNELIKLSIETDVPVFCVYKIDTKSWRSEYKIEPKIPILSTLGFPSIISAESIYQDISYFLGNVIKPSPDTMPNMNPEMTDKERIVNHGFDLKKSFRHRKI